MNVSDSPWLNSCFTFLEWDRLVLKLEKWEGGQSENRKSFTCWLITFYFHFIDNDGLAHPQHLLCKHLQHGTRDDKWKRSTLPSLKDSLLSTSVSNGSRQDLTFLSKLHNVQNSKNRKLTYYYVFWHDIFRPITFLLQSSHTVYTPPWY